MQQNTNELRTVFLENEVEDYANDLRRRARVLTGIHRAILARLPAESVQRVHEIRDTGTDAEWDAMLRTFAHFVRRVA